MPGPDSNGAYTFPITVITYAVTGSTNIRSGTTRRERAKIDNSTDLGTAVVTSAIRFWRR